MELLLDEIKKLASIDLNKIFAEVFSDAELQKDILNKVRYDQLFGHGVSEENIVIGYYSPYTESIKPEKKANTHYTLLDTGEFYESFKIYVNPTFFIIDADGEKTDEFGNTKNLFEVYNDKGNLIGLTAENMEWMINRIIPMINERIESIL